MKELRILDEPNIKGWAYSSNGDVVRKMGENWRPATRLERIRFELFRDRFAVMDFVYGAIIYFVLQLALGWLG